MGIGFQIRGADQITDLTEITDYFRMYEAELTMNAEEGSVGTSVIRAYDPDGTFEYPGHRHFRAYESTATGSNTVIHASYTAEREYSRGDYERTGPGRVIDITLTDINTVLARRVIVGSDAVRPAETDVARVQWWESSSEGNLVDDTRYLNAAGGVAMDAVDYSGQTGADVLNDCAQASGKNWFLWYAEDVEAWSLWYDFASSENHSSPLRLTNVLSDIDDTWTFAISTDTKLRRDPSRVFSGIYLPYDGGAVMERDTDTQNTFARRDGVMPSYNVKSSAKATARAQRYLADLDTEEDVITTTVILPAAKVNFLQAGMRAQFQAVHLPSYESYVWLRALNRTVRQISEEFYAVTLDLSAGEYVAPVEPPVVPDYDPAAAVLYRPINTHTGAFNRSNEIVFQHNGDAPPSGFPEYPLTGSIDYEPASANYTGFIFSGTGTVDIDFTCSCAEVFGSYAQAKFVVYLNGAQVASYTASKGAGLAYWSPSGTASVSGLAVTAGDELTCRYAGDTAYSGRWPIVPSGAGGGGLQLLVTGSLT